jgi:hypothetical protein
LILVPKIRGLLNSHLESFQLRDCLERKIRIEPWGMCRHRGPPWEKGSTNLGFKAEELI